MIMCVDHESCLHMMVMDVCGQVKVKLIFKQHPVTMSALVLLPTLFPAELLKR